MAVGTDPGHHQDRPGPQRLADRGHVLAGDHHPRRSRGDRLVGERGRSGKPLAPKAGQDGHGQDRRSLQACLLGPLGRPPDGGTHHLRASEGVDREQPHTEAARVLGRPADLGWDVVQLEVQEHRAVGADPADRLGPGGGEQRQAHLHERGHTGQPLGQVRGQAGVGQVSRYDKRVPGHGLRPASLL